jgi:hypothetical protein
MVPAVTLYRLSGLAALTAALTSYQVGDIAALRERAAFYARCGLLEDLAYGDRTGISAYTDKSLTALHWLFPRNRYSAGGATTD